MTIVPDDFSEATLQQLKSDLSADGFACYETAVGGGGYGVLPLSRATPQQRVSAEGGAEEETIPVRSQFEGSSTKDLHKWAESVGQWQYA